MTGKLSANALSNGRVFEEKVLGFHLVEHSDKTPVYLTLNNAIQREILENWRRLEENKGSAFEYDPSRPRLGETHAIWSAVKNFLPSNRRKFGKTPLQFYVSVGNNALDYYHGVDAFFWWQGVFVTIDLTLRTHKFRKADFFLQPKDLAHKNLMAFGEKVAGLLVARHMELYPASSVYKLDSGQTEVK